MGGIQIRNDFIKEAEVRGILASFCSSGLLKVASSEDFDDLAEKVASVVDDVYSVDDVRRVTSYIVKTADIFTDSASEMLGGSVDDIKKKIKILSNEIKPYKKDFDSKNALVKSFPTSTTAKSLPDKLYYSEFGKLKGAKTRSADSLSLRVKELRELNRAHRDLKRSMHNINNSSSIDDPFTDPFKYQENHPSTSSLRNQVKDNTNNPQGVTQATSVQGSGKATENQTAQATSTKTTGRQTVQTASTQSSGKIVEKQLKEKPEAPGSKFFNTWKEWAFPKEWVKGNRLKTLGKASVAWGVPLAAVGAVGYGLHKNDPSSR